MMQRYRNIIPRIPTIRTLLSNQLLVGQRVVCGGVGKGRPVLSKLCEIIVIISLVQMVVVRVVLTGLTLDLSRWAEGWHHEMGLSVPVDLLCLALDLEFGGLGELELNQVHVVALVLHSDVAAYLGWLLEFGYLLLGFGKGFGLWLFGLLFGLVLDICPVFVSS